MYSSIELANAKSLLDNFLSQIAMHLNIFFNNLITGSLFDNKHCKWGQWTFCNFLPIEIRGERGLLGQLVPFLLLPQFKGPHQCCKPGLGKRQYWACLLVGSMFCFLLLLMCNRKHCTVVSEKSVRDHLEVRRENN